MKRIRIAALAMLAVLAAAGTVFADVADPEITRRDPLMTVLIIAVAVIVIVLILRARAKKK